LAFFHAATSPNLTPVSGLHGKTGLGFTRTALAWPQDRRAIEESGGPKKINDPINSSGKSRLPRNAHKPEGFVSLGGWMSKRSLVVFEGC